MASSLEIDRARQQADVDRVLPYATYEAKRETGCEKPTATDVLQALLKDLDLQHLLVPSDFPLGTADALREAGVSLEVAPLLFSPSDRLKATGKSRPSARHSREPKRAWRPPQICCGRRK